MPRRLLLGAAGLVAVAVGVLAARVYAVGYGADNDTWLMLGTWDVLVDERRYVPSRPPGYLLPEVVIGATADLGGHWLSNVVSVLLAAATLWLLYRLIRRRTGAAASAALLVAVLGLTPAFVLAATTSMDYVYGLFGFVAGWTVLEVAGPSVAPGRHPARVHGAAWCGGLLLGLAAVSRLAYAPLGLVVVLLGPGRSRPARERGVAAAVLVVVAAVGYVPALRFAGDVSFLTAERPTGQGAAGVLGRALLKGGDLLGVVGTVVAVVVGVMVVRSARAQDRPAAGEWWLLVVAGVQLLIWLWIPAEPSYLLPALVALLVWVARPELPAAVTTALTVLVGTLALYAVVDVRLAEVDHERRYGYDTCDATEATGAELRPHVKRGPVLAYPAMSDALLDCNERQRAGQALRRAR